MAWSMRLTLANAIRWHSYASFVFCFLCFFFFTSSLTHKGCADVAPFRCNDFLRRSRSRSRRCRAAEQSKHTCLWLVRFACCRRRVLASSILFCLLFVPYVFMACKMGAIVNERESRFTLPHFASLCSTLLRFALPLSLSLSF